MAKRSWSDLREKTSETVAVKNTKQEAVKHF